MKKIILLVAILLITGTNMFAQVKKGDSPFYEKIRELSIEEREKLICQEIISNNIPEYMKGFVTIKTVQKDALGKKHKITLYVKPDYLTVGKGISSFIIPMTPKSAQIIADTLNCSLPTPKIVDIIYNNAELKLEPFNYIPRGYRNTTPDIFYDHSRVIYAQIKASGKSPGILVAGTKKDVVISSLLSDSKREGNVIIYGWHMPDGKPIQQVYNGHISSYVDYSHGIRLISNKVLVDGKEYNIRDILKDPILFPLLSNEPKPLAKVRYDTTGLILN